MQLGIFRVVGAGLLELYDGGSAIEFERRDLIVEPRLLVLYPPPDGWLSDPGEARQGFADGLSDSGPPKTHGEPFGETERIS